MTENPQQSAPDEPKDANRKTYPTDREGVYSATEGGVPDPTVRPNGGLVTDPVSAPAAPEAPAEEPAPEAPAPKRTTSRK